MRREEELGGRLRSNHETWQHSPPSVSSPWNAQDDVHASARRCIREYANLTDWLLLLDTDEYLYAEHDGVASDALSSVLGLLESDGAHGALVPWSMMYGEQLTLEAQIDAGGGLLRAFPRVLSVAQAHTPAHDMTDWPKCRPL